MRKGEEFVEKAAGVSRPRLKIIVCQEQIEAWLHP